ncbi:MAG: hypothetical protein M3O91_09800 [Chloroflexota bacterium]|nr:hypothetical protein [Chloroflexota bacterium]
MLIAIAAAAGLALALTVTTRDPAEPFAVATAVAALAVAAGALAAVAALWLAALGAPRGRIPARSRRGALRRGAEIGGAVGLLALLRAVDGLTPLTGSFIVLAFVVAEAVVSARAA